MEQHILEWELCCLGRGSMIKVIGNDAFLNFINLNNALLNNFSEKQINIFVIDKNKEIENLVINKSYKNNENNI